MRIPHTPARAFFLCTALLAGAVGFGPQEREPPDVSGSWHLRMTLPSGNVFEGTLTLSQDDGLISGTWRREGGDEDRQVRGEITGTAISFYWLIDLRTGEGDVRAVAKGSFAGEVQGDVMSGTARFSSRGEHLDWTATRES